MKRNEIKIGLFGFGCVGFGLYEVLLSTPGLRAKIKTVCIKNRDKARPDASVRFTFEPNEILNNPEINVVVELIDDADAAFQIVRTAMQNGKSVVSANKKMIAEHFNELLELQRTTGSSFLYEAACCASIPIIRNLEEYYDNDMLQSVEGIVNGSTNYILTKTATENMQFPEALKEAQEAGFAESNPFLDISGTDAKFKLLILMAHAFGLVVRPEEILNIGIDRIGQTEFNFAREKGYKIKLIASAMREKDGTITAFVAPHFISSHKKLFHVDDEYNGVVAKTAFADTQFFVGKGAGAHPTASAVLSDISALSYNYRYEYRKTLRPEGIALNHKIILQIMLTFKGKIQDQYDQRFLSVSERFENAEGGYLIGNIEFIELKKISMDPNISAVLCS